MPHASPMRKRFRQFLASLAVVHGVAIAGYYLFDVPATPERVQRAYAWVWMAATVAVAVIGLQRVKRARARNVIRRPATSEAESDRH